MTCARFTVSLFVFLACGAFVAGPVLADEVEREIQRRVERIEALAKYAESLERMDEGRLANAVIQRVQALEREVRHLHEERERRERRGAEVSRDAAAHRVESLVEALRTLGAASEAKGHEDLEALVDVVEGLVDGLARFTQDLEDLGTQEPAVARAKPAAPPERLSRDVAEQRLDLLRLAQHAFREREAHERVEEMERVIHAYELALAGRGGAEAKAARERAPRGHDLARRVGEAARIWAAFGHEDKARRLAVFARDLAAGAQREKASSCKPTQPSKDAGGEAWREGLDRQADVVRWAIEALYEPGAAEEREVLERVLHVYELALSGAALDAIQVARRALPARETLGRLLLHCGKLYADWGKPDRALACRELGLRWQQGEAASGASARENGSDRPEVEARLDRLEAQMREVVGALRALRKAVEKE